MNKLEELKKLRDSLKIEVRGIENYPADEPNVLISNHNCLMDIFYVPMIIPDNIVSLISPRLLYKKNKDRQLFVNKYLNSMPIEAHGGRIYSSICLSSAVKVLCNNVSLNIFPEGAYVEDNVIYRGRTGASRILFNAREKGTVANLVPVAIDIDSRNVDMDSYEPFDEKVIINILKPVKYDDSFYEYINSNDRDYRNECLHKPIDEGMKRIASSLRRKYVNEYITLNPKNNVMFDDGTVVPSVDAQSIYSVCKYLEDIEKRRVKILKNIK